MKKRLLQMLICMCLCLLSFFSFYPASAEKELYHPLTGYTENTDGTFFYSFSKDGDWSKKLSLTNGAWTSFEQSDGINHSGMLSIKPYAGMGAIVSGVDAVTMQAGENLVISGRIRYRNAQNLVKNQMYVQVYLTGLAGFPLYNDAACTDYYGEAEGGYVRVVANTDTAGKSFYDNKWHNFSLEFSSVMKHNTGKYVDMSDQKVTMWIRPFAGNGGISATTDFFKPSFITESENAGIFPYVDVNLDDLKGTYVKTDAPKATAQNVTVNQESVRLGDIVNIRYTLDKAGEDTSVMTLLQDGFPVKTLQTKGGASFVVTDEMAASRLTVELTPSVNYSDGTTATIWDFGTVGGGWQKLYAEAVEQNKVHYRLEGRGETVASEVLTAFYDENRKLLQVIATPIPAENRKQRTLAEGTLSCENASYATVYYWGKSNSLTPKLQCKMLHLYKQEERIAFYVDGKNGNDRNCGTEEKPVKTLETAKLLIQPYLDNMQSDVYVYVKGGTYTLNNPLEFGVKDSGRNGKKVVYLPWGEGTPVISGGKEYQGFEIYDESKNIWRTYVGVGTTARQVYINGIRAERARNDVVRANYINDDSTDGPGSLTNAVPDAENATYTCDDIQYASFQNQSDMEAVYYEYWTNPRVKVQKIEVNDAGKCVFYMQPASMEMGLNSTNCPTTLPMWFENAYELLNAEGEWYINKTDGYLYYKPRKEETPETMTATIPKLERAMTVAGDSPEEMVQNIEFRGFRFEMFTWLWPTNGYNSYRDQQANHLIGYTGDGKLTGGVEDAAVIVANADNVDFTDCVFTKLGGAGVNYRQIFRNCNLTGNHIYDISGSGINMGVASVESNQKDIYVTPTEETNFRSNNHITNNYIHDIGIEYRSCVGIGLSWIRDSSVSYNEIYNTNYSGMHIGWGWASYAETGTGMINVDIHHNYIHDTAKEYLCDTGGIYALGATGGSADRYNKIRNNYLENMRGTPAAIYPDEGSTFWEITQNVIDTRECPTITNKRYRNGHKLEWLVIHTNTILHNYIHDNYSTTNACRKFDTEANIYEPVKYYPWGNFPTAANDIISKAGLKPSYLEKMGDELQRLKLSDTEVRTAVGITYTIKATPMGRKLKTLSGYDIRFSSTDESVTTVDQNGKITAVGEGKCNVRAYVLQGDRYITASTDVIVE